MNIIDFAAWLQNQLDDRGWRPTELARRADMSDAAISRILRGERKADPDTLTAIAKALHLPPDLVFREAGLLPTAPNIDETTEQIIHELESVSEQEKEEVLAFIRMKNNLRAKHNRRP